MFAFQPMGITAHYTKQMLFVVQVNMLKCAVAVEVLSMGSMVNVITYVMQFLYNFLPLLYSI